MNEELAAAQQVNRPVSQQVLLRALAWGALLTAVLAIAFAIIGWFVAAAEGLIGGTLGALIGGVFLLLTVLSIAFANRFVASPAYIGIFFGIVLGSWLLKFVIFIVLLVVLKGQPWLHGQMLFFGLLASVIGALVTDSVVIAKSRIPLLNLPGA